MKYIWYNGKFKPFNAPILTAHDRIRLGEGLFSTILVVNGQLQFGKGHFDKLRANANRLWPNWNAPQTDRLLNAARTLLEKNEATKGEYSFNCTITGGDSGQGLAISKEATPNIIMKCAPYSYDRSKPIKTIISKTMRRNENSLLTPIKHSAYLNHILALREAEEHGAQDAILRSTTNNISSATVATIAIVKNGELITPPLMDGPQNGQTRLRLINDYGAIERSIKVEDLLQSEGVYLLNSLRGAIAVSHIDDHKIPLANHDLSKLHLDPDA